MVVNPTFIAGPSLVPALRSSLTAFKAIIEGTMPALPRQRFGVVDVRDVADAHITAMATPAAAGKRYLLLADGPTITWLGLAQILRDHLGPAGEHVTTDEAPGEDPSPLTIHNDRNSAGTEMLVVGTVLNANALVNSRSRLLPHRFTGLLMQSRVACSKAGKACVAAIHRTTAVTASGVGRTT